MYVTQRLEEIKNFTVDRASVDEMRLVRSDMNRLRAEHDSDGVPVPDWLTDQIATVNAEIVRRSTDDLQKRLREIKAQQTQLEPVADKRERLAREAEAIEAKLRGAPVPA